MGKKELGTKREYTEECKVETVRLADSIWGNAVAHRPGVAQSTATNRVRRRKSLVPSSQGPSVVTRLPVSDLGAGNARLRLELTNAKLNLDIVKRAMKILYRPDSWAYNRWNWYVRLANLTTRLEAITSRLLLLAGVARQTEHVGQSRLLFTLTHAAGNLIKSMVTNFRKGLDTVLATAPQLTKPERWNALVRYIVEKILATKPKSYVQPALMVSNFSQPLITATG
jgi:hypothetical protein